MHIQQASVKIHMQADSSFELDALTPIFHDWIRTKRISDQLLIDVADYQHVPNGPGIMLIAHEAHYGIDSTGGQPGLRYQRRRDPLTAANEALRDALARAARVAMWLEDEPTLKGKIKFTTNDLHMRVLNRLVAPNTKETQEALQPIWAGLLAEAGFAGVNLESEADSRSPFGLRMVSCSASPDLAALQAATGK